MKTAKQLLEEIQPDAELALRSADEVQTFMREIAGKLKSGEVATKELTAMIANAGMSFAKLVAFATANQELAGSLVDDFRGMGMGSAQESAPVAQDPYETQTDKDEDCPELAALDLVLAQMGQKLTPEEVEKIKAAAKQDLKGAGSESDEQFPHDPQTEKPKLQSVNVEMESLEAILNQATEPALIEVLLKSLGLGTLEMDEDAVSNMSPEGVTELKKELATNVDDRAKTGSRISLDDMTQWAKKRALQVKELLPVLIPTMLNAVQKNYAYFQKNYPAFISAARNPSASVDLSNVLLARA